jgi:hypothetical protein
MIAGLKQLAVRAWTRGVNIFGATLTPYGRSWLQRDGRRARSVSLRIAGGQGLEPGARRYRTQARSTRAILACHPSSRIRAAV